MESRWRLLLRCGAQGVLRGIWCRVMQTRRGLTRDVMLSATLSQGSGLWRRGQARAAFPRENKSPGVGALASALPTRERSIDVHISDPLCRCCSVDHAERRRRRTLAGGGPGGGRWRHVSRSAGGPSAFYIGSSASSTSSTSSTIFPSGPTQCPHPCQHASPSLVRCRESHGTHYITAALLAIMAASNAFLPHHRETPRQSNNYGK